MKEKSSLQNDLIIQSRDKRSRDRQHSLGQRRANSVVHNVEVTVFGARKLSDRLPAPEGKAVKTTKWAGMAIAGDPNHRFKRQKDPVRNWQDQMLIKAYMEKHSGHETSHMLAQRIPTKQAAPVDEY